MDRKSVLWIIKHISNVAIIRLFCSDEIRNSQKFFCALQKSSLIKIIKIMNALGSDQFIIQNLSGNSSCFNFLTIPVFSIERSTWYKFLYKKIPVKNGPDLSP